jgi:N-acetyl-anhydromuramoyl-L-alanine amidase
LWHDQKTMADPKPAGVPSMKIDPATGLLVGVRQVLTDHFDARPANVVPELIVVHGITLPPDEFGGPWIDMLFTGNLPLDAHPYFRQISGPGRRVSAHALINREGRVSQYVPFGAKAWHAGQSEYCGRAGCNDYSIGIELEGTDEIPYTDAQYDQLAAVVNALLATYSTLSSEHIAGHSDIAPGRKWDPGRYFDWPRFRAMVKPA